MRLIKLEIDNYRSFAEFTLELGGKSSFLISENGVGKTSLLVAIAKALGKDHSATSRSDFGDPNHPIAIVATVGDFAPEDHAPFAGLLNFTGKPTLRIGFRAEWDEAEQDVESLCGFPDSGWQKKASREQREAISVVWLPAWREPGRTLAVAASTSLLSSRLRELPLQAATQKALADIEEACNEFRAAPALSTLLTSARDALARLIPSVAADAFTLGTSSASERDLLRQFDLLLSQSGEGRPISRQSSGLAQLALFAFALERMAASPKAIVLVDEPEISLHPQAQRALTAVLRGCANQCLIATHSSNVLDRVDPRDVVRLARDPKVQAIHATSLSDADAKWLQRFANAQTAEAFFARKVALVEGYSDRIAYLALARRLGRELDGEGISVLSLEGGSGVRAYLALLGPDGLQLTVSGLCDVDKEKEWANALAAMGAKVTNRSEMNALGFFVCDLDLEDELVRALGVAGTTTLLAQEGETKSFQKFAAQPNNATLPSVEQLRRFVQTDKVRWAPILVDALDLQTYSGALRDAVSNA